MHIKGSMLSQMPSQPRVLNPSVKDGLPFHRAISFSLVKELTLCNLVCHLYSYVFSSACKSFENKLQNSAICVSLLFSIETNATHSTWSNWMSPWSCGDSYGRVMSQRQGIHEERACTSLDCSS